MIVSHTSPCHILIRFGVYPERGWRSTASGTVGNTGYYYGKGHGAIWFPYWIVTLVFATYPACLIGSNVRLRWRHMKHGAMNLCPSCGYDLRGLQHERCPECSNKVASSHKNDRAIRFIWMAEALAFFIALSMSCTIMITIAFGVLSAILFHSLIAMDLLEFLVTTVPTAALAGAKQGLVWAIIGIPILYLVPLRRVAGQLALAAGGTTLGVMLLIAVLPAEPIFGILPTVVVIVVCVMIRKREASQIP